MVHGLHFGSAQSVLAHVFFKQGCGVDGHRAVQEHRQAMRNVALCFELRDAVQHGLCAAHSKHRHHRHAATSCHAFEGHSQFSIQVVFGVAAVAVSGLDQHCVGLRWVRRCIHEAVVRTPQIT